MVVRQGITWVTIGISVLATPSCYTVDAIKYRPSVGSFQKWATAVGDDSFTFDRILPYYKKSVTFTPPNYSKRFTNTTLNYDPNAFDNSSRGPLQVSYPNWAAPFETWVQIGLDAIGIKRNYGFNSGNLFGSMWLTTTIDPSDETRSSSQTSFLDQATQTSGLQVYTQTLAKRILFNSNKTANGVLVTTMGQPYTLSARKEVILSAGVFQSPQLLMVSGIGPRSTLQYHDIPLLSELPGVGQNMWDHIIFGSSFRVNLLTDSELSISHEYAAQVTQLYLQNQSGPLTYPAGYVGYEKLPNRQDFSITANESLAKLPNDWPEIGYIPVDTYTGYNDRPATAILNDGNNYGTIVNVLVAPQSRGNVTIASPDTSDPPIINPNWLTDPTDAEVVVAAFKRTRQVWNHLEEITIGPEKLPGPTVQTDEEILAYIRQDFSQLYHAAATCAMGQEGESGAVVDSRGRVFGVKGLRVVDASAFPFLPPGLPQSTVYMLAEKISDDIKTGR